MCDGSLLNAYVLYMYCTILIVLKEGKGQSPQISTANRKNELCGIEKSVKIADLPQMCHFCGFVNPIFLVV
jgi:hypothetical protein